MNNLKMIPEEIPPKIAPQRTKLSGITLTIGKQDLHNICKGDEALDELVLQALADLAAVNQSLAALTLQLG